MGPKKREAGRQARGLPDTPAMRRRYKPRRLLTNRHYEAFPEEAEEQEAIDPPVKPSDPVRTSIKPVQCKSVFYSSRAAYTGNMTPDPEPVKRGGSGVKDEEQNLAVTPASVTSSSSGTDATFSLDEDDEEDCYSSSSSSSSSLPSPEIFRRDNDGLLEALTFSMKEETLDLHPDIKNSTLLDVSNAQNIHMHALPNISTISDASTTPLQKNLEIRGPEAATQIQTHSFKSALDRSETLKQKTPVKLSRPILCKKKVSFKTPVGREVKRLSVARTTFPNTSESAGRPSEAEQVKPHAEAPAVGELNSEDGPPQWRETLERPVKGILETARFFDFDSEGDRDLFFQRARERCVKLRSFTLFASYGC